MRIRRVQYVKDAMARDCAPCVRDLDTTRIGTMVISMSAMRVTTASAEYVMAKERLKAISKC
jgi:hypothetical protein